MSVVRRRTHLKPSEVLADINAGMKPEQIMEKYELTPGRLRALYRILAEQTGAFTHKHPVGQALRMGHTPGGPKILDPAKIRRGNIRPNPHAAAAIEPGIGFKPGFPDSRLMGLLFVLLTAINAWLGLWAQESFLAASVGGVILGICGAAGAFGGKKFSVLRSRILCVTAALHLPVSGISAAHQALSSEPDCIAMTAALGSACIAVWILGLSWNSLRRLRESA